MERSGIVSVTSTSDEQEDRRRRRRPVLRGVAAMLAVLGLAAMAGAPVAAAGSKVDHVREFRHHKIREVYYPDDICGARSGWTTYDITWHLVVTNLGDDYHASYVETGTYTTDLDDPAFDDYTSQFTEAVHVNLTRGGTSATAVLFHDFPGTVTIKTQAVLIVVDGEVRVDRQVFDVSGCP